jgi:hypothetical protein
MGALGLVKLFQEGILTANLKIIVTPSTLASSTVSIKLILFNKRKKIRKKLSIFFSLKRDKFWLLALETP